MPEAKPEGIKDENTREHMQKIASAINEMLPQDWGFFVLAFPFGDAQGRSNYASNGKREDIIRLMKEFLVRQGEENFMTHATESDLETALAESVKLQSHYAVLLNQHDGGERMQFDSGAAWMNRLRETGTLK